MEIKAENTYLAEMQDVYGLRWLVKSRTSSNEVYHVDLTDDLNGCQCKWHTRTYAPQTKLGNKVKHCFHWHVADNAANPFARKLLIALDKKRTTE